MTYDHAQAEDIVAALFTPEGRANPYPLYHRLRAIAPTHRSDVAHAWLLTRYDDCQAVLRDPRLGRGYAELQEMIRPDWRSRPALTRMGKSMLMLNGADHTRLRKLVSRAFTVKTIERMRPAVAAMVDDLLEPLAEAGGGDLMAELAFPLPAQVIAHMLGVPAEDVPPFRDLARTLALQFELDATPDMLDAVDKAHLEIEGYFTDLIAHKRREPGQDLISDLIAVEEGGDRLAAEEMSLLALLLFLAGFETTTNLIGNGMLGFIKHPDQVTVLRQRTELYKDLPHELLRYDSTVQLVSRMVVEPIEQPDGSALAPGEIVFALVGAGNHDPARFGDPDALDVTRPDVKELSFGGGVHFCLGAALARMELELVFSKLFDRFGLPELTGVAPHRDTLSLRGPLEVPLAFRPRGATRATTAVGWRPARGDDMAWRAQRRERLESAPRPDGPELDSVIGLFAGVGFFAGCSRPELTSLAATAYPIAFDAGDVLMTRGADAAECYVIAEGEVRVEPEDRPTVLIGAGDVVGERGPLFGLPRSATVTAVDHLIAYAISDVRLRDVIEANPHAAEVMREFVAARQPEPAA